MKADIPKEWENLVWMGKDDYMRVDYAKTNVILWGTVQELLKEVTYLKSEMTKMKNRMKGKGYSGRDNESEKSNKKVE